MTDFLQLCYDRVSVRRYREQAIPREMLEKILEAALLAPSSFGGHPVQFWIVQDKDLLNRLADCKAIGAPSIRNGSAAIVVAVDSQETELWIEDGAVASTHILLAAQEYGIGACWNQVRARAGKYKSTSQEIKDLLQIPSRFEVVSMISLGIPIRHEKRAKKVDWHLTHWAHEKQ